jgi:enoyl-CoA hydratase/carnithine racemase
MDEEWQRLKVWADGPVGFIVLNRPEVRNCLDYLLVTELERAVIRLATETRAIVIQGAGSHFCTGADLKYVAAIQHDPAAMRRFIEQINRAFAQIEQAPVPVIAGVAGYALAGGFELLQACDIVIVAEDAILGDQHANFGLLPGGGGSQRLPRLIGRQRALGLLLSGEWISGKEAASWGLAYRAVPAAEVEQQARHLAHRLAERSRNGLHLMKRLVHEGLERPLTEAIAMEIDIFCDYISGADASEGLRAFRERRAPRFAD